MFNHLLFCRAQFLTNTRMSLVCFGHGKVNEVQIEKRTERRSLNIRDQVTRNNTSRARAYNSVFAKFIKRSYFSSGIPRSKM
jgi:hypothetical protein